GSDIACGAATGIDGSDDRIATLQERRIDWVELHAVGHELQDPLVANLEAEAGDESRPDFQQRHAPELTDVVDTKCRSPYGKRIGRKRTVAEIDLRLVDVG